MIKGFFWYFAIYLMTDKVLQSKIFTDRQPRFWYKGMGPKRIISNLLHLPAGEYSDLCIKISGDIQEVFQAQKCKRLDAATCCPEPQGLETTAFNFVCSVFTLLSSGSCVCCLRLLIKLLDPNSDLLNSAHLLWSDIHEIQVPGSSSVLQVTCTFFIDKAIPKLELMSGNYRHVHNSCLHDPRITLYSVNRKRYNSSNLFQMFPSI